MSMLRFSQTLLHKVSFDEKLFEKELRKAVDKLTVEDAASLREWCHEQFPQRASVVNRCFPQNGQVSAA